MASVVNAVSGYQTGINTAYTRRIAFAAHGRVCQSCGFTRHLTAHHLDFDRTNYDPKNLRVLCRSCCHYAQKKGLRNE